jgi:hypothetical protein
MGDGILIYVLIGITFAAVLVFAARSKARTEAKLDSPHSEKSALAGDGKPNI